MKSKILLFLLLLISCSSNVNYNNLYGSWRLRDVLDVSNQNASDKTTFYKNGTVIFEIFSNKKLVTKINSKYILNKSNKNLTIYYNNNILVTYKIEKLNETELDLLDIKTKRIIRNIHL
jgi:hypothetical protein